MKRNFSFAVRVIVLVLLACIPLAISGRTSPETATRSLAWAAPRDVAASPYRNVVVVATSGGDFDSVQKALNSITDNSATNPYLVWVAPGIYTEAVTMKQYV